MLKRLAIGLLVLLAAALAAGVVYQSVREQDDRAAFPPPGTLLEVDGLTLHIDCRGQGSPTIVIESGLMTDSTSWGLVHDQLANQTRTCAYDRAGLGWSEPADELLSAVTVAERLDDLLTAAGIGDSTVLVGMSAGGVFVREYYHRHGENVVGMVLVDSSHEQQGHRLPAIASALDLGPLLSFCSLLQPVGVVRAFDLLGGTIPEDYFPPSLAQPIRANAYQSHTCEAMRLESEGFELEVVDVQPPAPLGDLPLVVLSQGRVPTDEEIAGFDRAQVAELQAIWDQLQQELTALSSNGRRVIAADSGHMIQHEAPELVVREISTLISQLRTATPAGQTAHGDTQRPGSPALPGSAGR